MNELETTSAEQLEQKLIDYAKEGLNQIDKSFSDGLVLEGHKRIDILTQTLGASACHILAKCISEDNAFLIWDLMQTRITRDNLEDLRSILSQPFIHEHNYREIRSPLIGQVAALANHYINTGGNTSTAESLVRYYVPYYPPGSLKVDKPLVQTSANPEAVIVYNGGETFKFGAAGIVAYVYRNFQQQFFRHEDGEVTIGEQEMAAQLHFDPSSITLFALGVGRLLDVMEPNERASHRQLPRLSVVHGVTNLKMAKEIERYGFKIVNPESYEGSLKALREDMDSGRITLLDYHNRQRQLLQVEGITVVADLREVGKKIRQEWQIAQVESLTLQKTKSLSLLAA